MPSQTNRRSFLKTSLTAGLSLAALETLAPSAATAIEPLKRKGSPRMHLSLAAYSFRDSFKTKDAAKKIDLFQFVDYCAEQGLDGAELTVYYFPPNPTDDYLIKLKRHAFLRGIELSGSAVGNNFGLAKGAKLTEQIGYTKKWIDRCAILGVPHIRVFAWPQKIDVSLAEAKKICIESLEECCDYAGTKGIFLGLENHGALASQPDDLMEIVRAVKSPWLGVNLDTGNFHTENPYADLARFAPYAVNVQYKVEVEYRGKEKQIADMPRVIKILRDANYQGYVALEHEKKEDPWQTVPGWLKKLKEALAA